MSSKIVLTDKDEDVILQLLNSQLKTIMRKCSNREVSYRNSKRFNELSDIHSKLTMKKTVEYLDKLEELKLSN